MTSESRWATVVQVSSVFTDEQAQRAQALRVAREVCETKEPGKSFGTPGGVDAGAPWLIEFARWIIDGTMPDAPVELQDED